MLTNRKIMESLKKGYGTRQKVQAKSKTFLNKTDRGDNDTVPEHDISYDKPVISDGSPCNHVLSNDSQRRQEVEIGDGIENVNKAKGNTYIGHVTVDEDTETNIVIKIEKEYQSESGSRYFYCGRTSYGNINSDMKSLIDKFGITQELAVSTMSVPELVRKAEMGDMVLDDRGLSQLQKRFVSMHSMVKRQFYRCGDRYIIPEQITSWSEDCTNLHIKSNGTGDDTLNRKVALMHGDITTLEVDAVVNYFSSQIIDKHEAVSMAVVKAASALVYYELEYISSINRGDVEATAGYLLPAKYILHTSVPASHYEYFEEQLKQSYRICLDKMIELGLRTLALPCIATGSKKANVRQAAQTALATVKEWLQRNKDSVDKIIFCVYDIDNWACYQEFMPEIFPPGDKKDTSKASLLPVEILRMDKTSIELYKRALSEGQEAVHNIRLMVVGHYGVGKTTLTKRLFREDVDINKRDSTNGIDVHVRRCKVSLDTGQWNILGKDHEEQTIHKRLIKLLKEPTAYDKNLKMENKEKSTDIDKEKNNVNGLMSTKDKSEENYLLSETTRKQAVERDNSENVLKSIPKTLQVETSAVGKTEKNLKDDYILNQLKEIIEEVQKHTTDDEDTETADVSVWDFAGQYVFYATHQVFLSRRAVYLLVTDISKHVEDIVEDDDCFLDSKGAKHCKISEFVEFWLNSIHEFCTSAEGEGPPVLLVGTFADKLNQETKDETIDEFFYTLRSSLVDKATSCHLIDEDFAVDNSIIDSNIESLRQQIVKTASSQSYWGELIPAKWITLENILVSLKDGGLKVLRKDKLLDLNSTLPIPIATEEEVELFLRFHHESGNALYYSDEKLNDSIILDPQWLIDAFKSLITAKMFCCRKPKIFKKWIQFDESAILTRELVEAIWEKEENSVFHEHKELLLDYLEKLGFIAKPRQESDDTEVTNFYFAPCVLKKSPPEDLVACNDCENRTSTSKLCLTMESGFLPTAIFNKLLAACISKWPLARKNKNYLIFCGCGIFDLGDNHTLFVYFFDHVVQIWISKLSIKGHEPSIPLCLEVYEFVSEFLQNRLRLFSSIREFLKCQYSDLLSTDTMFTVEQIAQKPEIVCNCTVGQHVLPREELTKYWRRDKSDHKQNALMDKDINRIAHHIGKEYQSLGLELGLSQAEIDHVNLDGNTTVDRIRGMLLKWKSKAEGDVSLDVLRNAMEAVGINAQTVLENCK